ncbi:MAG: precorrin-6y C5,15-methyltransferase (decarboxylating) subunit CbiE [Gammaproteobacteria bacterium]|nr:precorrin-6y C5,15-methyltransferase (decarboxylating) subunit CbiE [Gammaproteobacteria bacterium]MBU1656065.1 precorrin-6y C5,15-methyltransferase (decarboxylating) subunit CbiE [Gammaproteobacteria bacterium]MBU1960489.1 precorrin-6y C5,15-methyltransferase (decarboxylating) subunit CbiE [Gammaproteobacteria bacterium]
MKTREGFHQPVCTILGILDDGWPGLSEAARQRLQGADLVIGAGRTLALVYSHLAPGCQCRDLDGALGQLPDWIRAARSEGRRAVVLATGDPLCHGIAGWLVERLGPEGLEVLPATSTLQLAFARLKRPWQDYRIASCHGGDAGEWRPGEPPGHGLYPVIRAIAEHPRVAVFTSPANGPARLARALLIAGYGAEVRLSVAARLALPDERLFPGLGLEEAAAMDFPLPNLVLLEREAVDPGPLFGLEDGSYVQRQPTSPLPNPGQHAPCVANRLPPCSRLPGGEGAMEAPVARSSGSGLITKLEARAVSLAKLGIRADSTLWDIGAGSGAVGLEAARLAYRGHVWAIEKNPADAAIARENARRLRATNYSLVEGKAPAHLEGWPDPDAIFIGGSGGELEVLIGLCLSRLSRNTQGGRLVMNFATLENLATATRSLDAAGAAWELTQIQAARSVPILGMHRLAAQNPIWILTLNNPVGCGER